MIGHYFRISIRNLLKQKVYSVINIGGLSIGLACFILIMVFVQYEFTYDRFLDNSNQIYRVYQQQAGNEFLGSDYFALTPSLLSSIMIKEFPEVKQATSVVVKSALLGTDDHNFWEHGLLADKWFFRVFPFPFIEGNPEMALQDASSIVITRSLSIKIFGQVDPIGREIKYQNEHVLKVTAVVSDPPENSSLSFSFIASLHTESWYQQQIRLTTWKNNSVHTFLLLALGAQSKDLEAKFPTLLDMYRNPDSYRDYPFRDRYFVQPIKKMHLTPGVNFDIGVKGNIINIYLFSTIAVIVLLIACINYMNLAIARTINRSREVGLSKVIGASQQQLVVQFLGESVLTSLISLLIALGFVCLLIPVFSRLVNRDLALNFHIESLFLTELFALVILTGILSGSYPALFMARMKPITVLKGNINVTTRRFSIRHWLIVGQFATSLILISCSLVIWEQLKYLHNKDLGFTKDNIISMRIQDPSLMKNYADLYHEWQKIPGVKGVTVSTSLPTNISSSQIINDRPGSTKDDDIMIYVSGVDYNYLSVFGINLIAGRNFSPASYNVSERYCLLNETATKELGWTTGEAEGKQFYDGNELITVIGVIRDFNMHSLHLDITPLMIQMRNSQGTGYGSYISLKLQPGNISETLAALENVMKKYSPYPFDYHFLTENYDQLYSSDIRLGKTIGFFAFLSVLIATIGLFGLAAYSTSQRTKEIGNRKVLGATTLQIVALISWDWLLLVGIGFIISIPFAWYVTHQWLQRFAYHIEMQWWIILFTGLLALILTNLAVGYQSVRASLTNPVESLRSE